MIFRRSFHQPHLSEETEARQVKQGMRMITYTYPPNMIISHAKEALKALKEGFIA